MTNEHFRILLSNPSHFQWLFRAAEELAKGDIPAVVVDVVRLGRMTALQKPDGGVRGIVVGDVLRRLVGARHPRPRTRTPAIGAQDGNTKLPAEWKPTTEQASSSLVRMRGREHCAGHRVDLWQECLSPLFPETLTPAWSRTRSGFCCSAVSACLSLPQFTCVDVAAIRTLLATIAQRAPKGAVGQTRVCG